MDPDEVFTKVCSSRIPYMEDGASKHDALLCKTVVIFYFRHCFSKANRAYHRCRTPLSAIRSEYV